jgi:hypothetical protein
MAETLSVIERQKIVRLKPGGSALANRTYTHGRQLIAPRVPKNLAILHSLRRAATILKIA